MTKPITPEEALKAPDVSRHFDSINTYLNKPWSTYDRTSGRWYDTKGIPRPEVEAVMQHYRSAGWDVSFHDSQREGVSIRFKPRTSAYRQ